MKVSNRLQRNSLLTTGLLLLAGASGLLGQTTAQPFLVLPTGNLHFAYQTGRAVPAPQTVRIYSAPENVSFTATATTNAGGGWLFLCTVCDSPANNVPQLTWNTGTGQNLTVSVTPAGLPAAATPYTGKITVVSGNTVSEINVSLTVSATSQLSVSPASFPLQNVEMGGIVQLPITVNSTDSTPLTYTAAVENPTPNVGWIAPSVPFGITGSPATININTQLLPAGTTRAWGAIRFTVFGSSGQSVTVPITVSLAAASQVQVTPGTLNFAYQPGFSLPASKQVAVNSSTATALTYSVAQSSAGPNYFTLSTTPTAGSSTSLTALTTPNGFWVTPNVNALGTNPAPGNYETIFTVTATNGTTQTFTARLQVTNQPLLTSSVDFVNFSYTLGGIDLTPATVTVGSTSGTPSFSAVRVLDPGVPAFFSVSAANPFAGNPIQITPDMAVVRSLPAGTYAGKVRVTSVGAAGALELTVTLSVSGSAQLNASVPPAFESAIGVSPGERTVVVVSTDPNVQQNFSASVDYPASGPRDWLIATPTSGTTGSATTGTIRLTVDPTRITAAGTYGATLVIRPTSVANGVPVYIPVEYRVTPGVQGITASPSPVLVTQNGNVAPATQTIQLTSGVATSYTARIDPLSDPQFVSIVPQTAFNIPGSLQIVFDKSSQLAPRAEPYVNNVVISPAQPGLAAVTIPVRLTVVSPSNLQVNPASLSFAFTTGGATPATQQINLTSTGTAVAFTAAAASTQGTWLSVTPTSGTTNATGGAATPLTVSVNPVGLAAGTYNGTVTITPTSGGGQPVTVNVSLRVNTPTPPSSLAVSNNASGISRGVSPGQFITIKGSNMAPATPISFQLVNGAVPTTLGEVRVLFDNVPAPITYVGPSGDRTSDQINAIVPYGVSGRASTNVVVEYRNVQSSPIPLTVRETEPGIFTANSAGTGAAAMLNQDSSYNTQQNPAAVGSVIQIFGTGEGLIAPAPGDGRVVPATPPFPSLLNSNVAVRINGRTARVVYAGPAPGLLAGVFQINAEVPADLGVSGTASASLEVQIGNTNSQPGVTFFVRGQQ